jgi:hypothetical protein
LDAYELTSVKVMDKIVTREEGTAIPKPAELPLLQDALPMSFEYL